jgi:hypothetical protein
MRPTIRNANIHTKLQAASSLAIALLVFLVQPLHSQTPSPQEKPMKHYALLFHTTRTLTPEEMAQRKVEIAAWVEKVTSMGITLDPRALGETAASFSAKGTQIIPGNTPIDPTLSNLVFFDSPTKDQAVEVARIHPGLHYGVTVDVREWTSPRQTAANP